MFWEKEDRIPNVLLQSLMQLFDASVVSNRVEYILTMVYGPRRKDERLDHNRNETRDRGRRIEF